jgi:norsolorinic acid ketoreductase
MAGIGRGLTTEYLSRDNSTVIAAVRDVTKETSKNLSNLLTGENSKLILVKIDSLAEDDAKKAIETLVQEHAIDHLDVVIANAGDCKYAPLATVSLESIKYHHSLNTVGPLLLFQASWPLLQKSTGPKFIVISSALGSIAEGPKYKLPGGAYGASKAAVNYYVAVLHYEHPELVALPICPG